MLAVLPRGKAYTTDRNTCDLSVILKRMPLSNIIIRNKIPNFSKTYNTGKGAAKHTERVEAPLLKAQAQIKNVLVRSCIPCIAAKTTRPEQRFGC